MIIIIHNRSTAMERPVMNFWWGWRVKHVQYYISGLDVNIKTPSDCDKAFNISENGEVNINFAGSVFTRETDKVGIWR